MLLNLTELLLANSSFMPHGMCYLWKPGLVGLHLLSNAVIALSYFSIPFTLVYILRKRPDIPFNGIFLLFAAFIVSCGIGHAFDIWTLWHPNYWLAGNIKAMTASVSLLTAIALIKVIPQIIALPSPQQMQEQIREREQAEIELIKERHFLQTLLNNLSDGIVACDQNGVLTLFNQATQEIHGLPQQFIHSENWAQYYDLYLPDGQTMMSPEEIPLFRALHGEAVRNVEMMIIPKQGEPRLLLANGDPIIASDGEKLGAVVAMRDITERKLIEEALHESEARFSEAFSNAAIGIAIVSLEGQWLEINPALCQMLNYSEAELLATNYQSITYPEDLDRDLLYVEQLISGEISSCQIEKRYLSKQGEIVWVHLSVSVVKNEKNQPLYFVALIKNITHRKEAEQALRESERRFRAIFNSMFQFIGLLKPDGTVLEVNQTALDFGGFKLEEIVNRPFWEISWWRIDNKTQYQLQQAITQAASGEFVRYEVDILGANERIATIDFSIKPVRDETGQISLLIPEGRDITASKKIQEELRKNEQRWQLAIQSTGDGIWDWNVQTNEVYYSPRWKEMRGYQNDEIRGNLEQWAELVYPDDYELVMKAVEQHFNKRIPFKLEYRTLHRDGSYRWILTQGQAVWDKIGQVIRMVGAETDITERKQAQTELAQLNEQLEERVRQRTSQLEQVNKILLATTSQLEKRNQELDQFAYVASHDLKAPLRAIANLSEWLEEDLEDKLDDDTRHNLNLLRGRVHRLENLINGLLAYSRVGRVSSEFQLVSVERLLNDIIDSLAVPPEFTIEIIGEMPTLRTQLLPLQQTLSNLIDNAITHHPRQDGKVSISVVEQENFYEFTITDDGKGIDPKYHDKIFTIFQTLEARDNKESTGIGLSIVKKAVENQGGAIALKSQLGQGSSFRFTWKKN
ncbi:two-component sensor histidine kinase [Stanieria sp. NIES-3757]|nr:two-component sensor histidine kinase [Stanieria sp. NIES-3757]